MDPIFTARVLPPEEWSQCASLGNQLALAWAQLPVDGVTVIVVEDGAGAIVGSWCSFACVHVEGVWVAEPHRKRGIVAGRLLHEMMDRLRDQGVTAVITAAETPDIVRLLQHLHATPLPGQAYALPVGEP